MRKVLFVILAIVLVANILFAIPTKAEAPYSNDVVINYFWGDGCPHCAKEKVFLDKLEASRPNVEIRRFEVWYNRQNARLMGEVGKYLEATVSGVPFTVVGDQYVTGFMNEQTTGRQIEQLIEMCELESCPDVLQEINATSFLPKEPKENKLAGHKINLPLFGEIDSGQTSLFAITTAIAFLDGFNPCAMWVLLFLITLLLGMKSKKRRWLLGSVFIITSGAVYFLFLAAWLNIFLFIGAIAIIRIIIGLVAIGSGCVSLRSWWNQKTGCVIEGHEKRQRIFAKLREIVAKKNMLLALIGVILIAAAVNLVELVCSAGLPAIYIQTLTLSELPTISYYLYLLWYIIIFMIDDMIVFVIAMVTLQAFSSSSKYALYTKLIGGIIILLLGIILIFKPGWLMFG